MWLSPTQLRQANPGITEGMLRKWLFNRDTNGLEKLGAVKKPRGSSRLLIHAGRFDCWVDGSSKRGQ